MAMKDKGLNQVASEVMNPRVITATRGTNVNILVRQLLTGQFSGLPVVEDDGEVVGIVSEFDVIQALLNGQDLTMLKAEDIMNTPAVCVTEESPLIHVLQLMIEHRIIRLPVVRNRKLVGMISRPNILSQMVDVTVPKAHVLPVCYWCERICDDVQSQPHQEIWCDLAEYLQRHGVSSVEITFSPKFCPSCAPVIRHLMEGSTPAH
ncbi:CBS domain-containing protein [Candidatus Nitronereus thalassa]|uniref:CBS domain-containing protein n=1 Tax=Candidatus Nitronereus thalassa TaxID=3020898 RepID=A0ABU3K8U4_9BACT|nr:CBS domain-containing protein [Candidatus Nitronereus thalassa]MDT7042801.1 CBS domain-containing protein [Candidatus Nitronereus thalassa]